MSDKVGHKKTPIFPLLLQGDNFTSLQRTPWGGTFIRGRLKRQVLPGGDGERVGESWELSLGPELESRTSDGKLVSELIAGDQKDWFGSALDRARLLVKIIDARSSLSLQLHPADDDPKLKADEAGKTEAWYVIAADAGAGVYLGFQSGTTREMIANALQKNMSLEKYLRFVPAQVGDVFLITARMPHAIGAGLVLVEPQVVRENRRGVTYRFWDWDRRYDKEGNLAAHGQPRELHTERALELTAWNEASSSDYLSQIHRSFDGACIHGAPTIERLCGKHGPIVSQNIDLQRVFGTGQTSLAPHDSLRALTVLDGSISLRANEQSMSAKQGQTLLVPASCAQLELELAGAHATLSGIPA